ncbi:MAG: SGNH/GDSL hydrolase family protein [Methylomonas sp.]
MASSIQTFDLVRYGMAGFILAIWGLTFITAPGGRWFGLRPFRPRSSHWLITLIITGSIAAGIAILIWPHAPGQRTILGIIGLLMLGELFKRRFPEAPSRQVTLSAEKSLYTSRLYQPHHYTLFEPRPNIRSAEGLEHNRYGFRDRRLLEPDPNAIRLVFMGGPTVYGITIQDNNQLFTHLLEERLNEAYRDRLESRHFEVINAGMANATSAEMLLRLIFAVSEIRPALVAIQAGICDTWPRVASDDYFGDFRQIRKRYGHGPLLQPRLSVADSLARALIWRSALLDGWLGNVIPAEPLLEMTNHSNTGRRDRLATNPPHYFERNLDYMLALNQAMGARSLLIGDQIPVDATPDNLYGRAVPEHHAVMAGLAERRRVPYFDLASALPLSDDIRERDKYLNAEGQRRLAEQFFNFLLHEELVETLLLTKNSSC